MLILHDRNALSIELSAVPPHAKRVAALRSSRFKRSRPGQNNHENEMDDEREEPRDSMSLDGVILYFFDWLGRCEARE